MSSQSTVYYFISSSGNNPVSQFLDSLSAQQQSKVLRLFQHIRIYGLSAIIPHIKKLSGFPLWEIRILGRDNIRIIYAVPLKNIVLILHGFINKTQKIPIKELRVALIRFEQWNITNKIIDK